MVALHEALAMRVEQPRAFAAQRLGDQEARRSFDMQRGGMELDELQIADLRAGAIGHRHAIAGRHVGIGGVQKNVAQPAGSQQDGARVHGVEARFAVPQERAGHAIVEKQIDGRGVTAKRHIGKRRGLAVERLRDFAAGGIAMRMQNAIAAVRAFARKREMAAFAIERGAPLDQLFDGRGPAFH